MHAWIWTSTSFSWQRIGEGGCMRTLWLAVGAEGRAGATVALPLAKAVVGGLMWLQFVGCLIWFLFG